MVSCPLRAPRYSPCTRILTVTGTHTKTYPGPVEEGLHNVGELVALQGLGRILSHLELVLQQGEALGQTTHLSKTRPSIRTAHINDNRAQTGQAQGRV